MGNAHKLCILSSSTGLFSLRLKLRSRRGASLGGADKVRARDVAPKAVAKRLPRGDGPFLFALGPSELGSLMAKQIAKGQASG